jgi:hypothetical protein
LRTLHMLGKHSTTELHNKIFYTWDLWGRATYLPESMLSFYFIIVFLGKIESTVLLASGHIWWHTICKNKYLQILWCATGTENFTQRGRTGNINYEVVIQFGVL